MTTILCPPLDGCSCAVCRRRRRELELAEALEAEWWSVQRIRNEAKKPVPTP